MKRKRNRSKYGDPRMGRAVTTAAMALSSASSAVYYCRYLGGVVDAQLLARWFELANKIKADLIELSDRENKAAVAKALDPKTDLATRRKLLRMEN